MQVFVNAIVTKVPCVRSVKCLCFMYLRHYELSQVRNISNCSDLKVKCCSVFFKTIALSTDRCQKGCLV